MIGQAARATRVITTPIVVLELRVFRLLVGGKRVRDWGEKGQPPTLARKHNKNTAAMTVI